MGYDGEIKINTTIDIKNSNSQLLSLENKISKTADKINLLKEKIDELKSAKIPTDAFAADQQIIDSAKKKLDKLVDSMEKFKALGKDTGSNAFTSMQYDADELRNTIAAAEADQKDLISSGEAYKPNAGTEEYEKLNQQLKQEQSNMNVLVSKHNQLIGKQNEIGNSAERTVDRISKSSKKAGSIFTTLASRLRGILLSLLILNWISKAWNAMIKSIKDGINNLVQYSSKANATMSNFKSASAELKNTLAVAFAPILNTIVPALTTLINWLTYAIDKFNEFMAILSGASSWTKATKQNIDYAKSLDKTSKSAKSAEGSLASFDKLNVLSKQDSGGGAGTELTGADAFKEMPIDKTSAMAKAVEALKEKAKELKDIFDKGFWDGFNNGGAIFQDLLSHLDHLKEVLAGIWNDPSVSAARDEWIKSSFYALGQIAGAGADIGITIADNIFGGLDTYFTQNTQRVKDWLVSMFNIGTEINTLVGNFASAFAYVFEAFASQSGIQMTANLIGIFVDAFMGLTELAGKFARDIIKIITDPFVKNKEEIRTALEGILEVFSRVFGAIKLLVDGLMDQFNKFYDQHLKPFFDAIADGLTSIMGTILSVVNGTIIPILLQFASLLAPFVTEYILPLSQAIMDFLGNVVDLLSFLWTNVLVPVIDWIIANILPILAPIFAAIGGSLLEVIEIGVSVMTAMINSFNAIITFLKTGFTKGWGEAWTNLKDALGNIWDMMIEKVKDVVDKIGGFVESMVNKAIDGINKLIEGFNSIAHIKMPEWLGGESVSFSIPTIPHLATGGVIEGGSPFFAMLGDQPAGQTNVEAPLDTIVQAMREALGGGQGSGNMNITMEMDGETLARVSMPYFSAESNRIGINLQGA